MFNKNHVLKFNGYDELLQVFEDYDLWLRIKDESKFTLIQEILQFQRIRKNSLSNCDFENLKRIIYGIQNPYYNNLDESFKISDQVSQNKLKGWREFFYGNKNLCRNIWIKINLNQWDYRMLIAYLISFLPQTLVDHLKKQRIRLRVEYLLNKRSKFMGLDKEFRQLLKEVSG